MSCCSSGPKTPVFVGNKCALLWSWWAATTTYLKRDFYFAFVKVAVAMQNIHQFASNLMPLLMCLKLTLICCEVVPLIRNSLNSQPQIALAEHCRIPGDATPHSYCMSSPTVHRGRAIYHCTPLGKNEEVCSGSCFALVCLRSQGQESDRPMRWTCPRASDNQCGDVNRLAWQNAWQLKEIKAWAHTLIQTQIFPKTLDPPEWSLHAWG